LDVDAAVEIAFGFEHGFDVVGRFFGEEADLLFVQLFVLLLGNQRQVFFEHGFDFAVFGFDFDGKLGCQFTCFGSLLGLPALLEAGNRFVVFGTRQIGCGCVSVGKGE